MFAFLERNKQRLWEWVHIHAANRSGQVVLAVISFAESSFFPIPPDPFLMTIISAGQRKRWLFFVGITTVASVVGGLFGYFIGWGFFETIGVWLVERYDLADEVAHVGTLYQEHAFWSVFTAAFTPIPYKVFTIAAGLFHIDIVTFIIASLIGRGIRFLLMGLLAHYFGEYVAQVFFKYFNALLLISVIGIVGVLIALTFV